MKTSLVIALVAVASVSAIAQQPSVSPSTASSDELREAYGFCTKRYIEHDAKRRYDATGKETAKWQAGFESCDKIVSAWETKQNAWNDTTQHKSKIDTIAGSQP